MSADGGLTRARANRIEALRHSLGWTDLEKEFAAAEERYWRRHRAEVMAGKPIDQRELDFMRGKFDALKAILKQPERAARFLDQQEAKKEAEQREE